MIKVRNRKLAMVLVLAMIMTMFAGLGTASAATTTYSCLQAPYIAKGEIVSSTDSTIGTILIDWDVLTKTDSDKPHAAVITLPNGLEFADLDNNGTPDGTIVSRIFKPGTGFTDNDNVTITRLSSKEARIEVVSDNVYSDVQVALLLEGIKVSSSAPAGPVNVTFGNLRGLFPQGSVTVGNITGGAAQVTIIDTVTIKEGDPVQVEFTVQEDTAKGVEIGNKTIEFKLPKGFTWANGYGEVRDKSNDSLISGNTGTEAFQVVEDDRVLIINRRDNDASKALERSIFKVIAKVEVDETEANFGDVNVNISGKSTLVPNSVTIGTYSDYGYEVVVDEVAEILSGRAGEDAEIEFTIKENVEESLLDGRTIYFTLPDGVEWMVGDVEDKYDDIDYDNDEIAFECDKQEGNLYLDNISIVKNKPEMLKATIRNDYSDKGEVDIEAELRVAANFVGDITIEISGSAGIDEEITVAKAIAPLTGSVDMVDVKIGAQEQLAGDITITEAVAEALLDDGDLILDLPAGVSWAKLPTITADKGLSLGTATRKSEDGTSNNQLVIPIRAQSDEAATITISDVYLTVDRTVPEGELKVSVKGDAINQANIPNRGTALSLKVAEVVTPAPGETVGSCEFKIGSNIYYVGGVAKVMDVAPYIKSDRTYVPMRYLGEALGAEVVWDDAARTVTLTRGETTVVFTIGSTTYTVNGEALTADVAPEIANDRTMLPARFVAEAFGAVVGWDAATQTVLIQK